MYIYTSGAESDQFNLGLIRGTAFTRIVRITRPLVQSSSIQFTFTSEIKPVRIDSNLAAGVNGL